MTAGGWSSLVTRRANSFHGTPAARGERYGQAPLLVLLQWPGPTHCHCFDSGGSPTELMGRSPREAGLRAQCRRAVVADRPGESRTGAPRRTDSVTPEPNAWS